MSHLAAAPGPIRLTTPDDAAHQHREGESATPAVILLPDTAGPSPWSDKPILNDPRRFQIAIMTDRTGGHRPGIWMEGVRRLNMLRPEFVVSVGDLIEGYTEDRSRLNREWEEFLGFTDQLEMKFFFVAGNHDLTNPVMHDVWRERFGPRWYSFDYKEVHFVCLCSEDPVSKLGAEQLEWLERDLAAHKSARWTLVFLHKPLWVYAEREKAAGNADKTGWDRVEAALGDRPRTVFSGHHHSYVQFDRAGMKYYQLATTGGASQLRGKSYGEFDHVVWMTMEPDGPHVANLLLDGVAPANVVTEQSIANFRKFLTTARLDVAPILIDDSQGFQRGRIDLRLVNQFDEPVQVEGRLEGIPLRGLTLEPGRLAMRAPAGGTAELAMSLTFLDRVPYAQLAGTSFLATVRSVGKDALLAERTIPLVIARKHLLTELDPPPTVDGRLEDWDALPYGTNEISLVLDNSAAWQGPGDASVRFNVGYDREQLLIAGDVQDDRVTGEDQLVIRIDARPLATRAADGRLRQGTYRVELPATEQQSEPPIIESRNQRLLEKAVAAAVETESGYAVEAAIPLSLIKARQSDEWHSIQFTAIIEDYDEPGAKPSRVVWRGTADVDSSNRQFAHFVNSK